MGRYVEFYVIFQNLVQSVVLHLFDCCFTCFHFDIFLGSFYRRENRMIITFRNRHGFGPALKVRYGKGWSIDVQILKSIGVDLEELEAFESPGLWRAVARRFRVLYSPYRVGILYSM